MTGSNQAFDCVVVGAGPCGSTVASQLARDGYRVAMLDKQAFPRFKVGESMIPFNYFPLERIGMLDTCKHHPDVADSDVTLEYMMDHNMCIGSPATVERKIADIVDISGGFGQLLVINYDHLDDFEGWRESKTRLAQEIMPKFSALSAAPA